MYEDEWVDGYKEVTELSPAPKEKLEDSCLELIPSGLSLPRSSDLEL